MTGSTAWNHCLTLANIRHATTTLRLAAAAKARARIAGELGLEALKVLEAEITVQPWLDGVDIRGRLRAVATRLCGLSLEAFDETVDEPINFRIVPVGSPNVPREAPGDLYLDPGHDDPPDEAQGSTIDLCAYVVEHLALALTPFPRKPGAVFEPPIEVNAQSPFAALAKLKMATDDE